MSLVYVGCMKFHTNWFVGKFCPSFFILVFKEIRVLLEKKKIAFLARLCSLTVHFSTLKNS
jgi:hypothetical protein